MGDEYDSISAEVKKDNYLNLCGFEVLLQGELQSQCCHLETRRAK